MTRKQVKKQIEKIRELMLELKDDIETTIDEIEPYEGKEELTEQQEERKEWLEGCQYELETALSFLLQNGIIRATPEGLKTTDFGNLIAKSNYAVETAVKIKEYVWAKN